MFSCALFYPLVLNVTNCKIIHILKQVCVNYVTCNFFEFEFFSFYSLMCSSLLQGGQSTNINEDSFYKHDLYWAYNVCERFNFTSS